MIIYTGKYAVKDGKIHRYTFKEELRNMLLLFLFGYSFTLRIRRWLFIPLFCVLAYIRYRYQTISYSFGEELEKHGSYNMRKLLSIGTISVFMVLTPFLFYVKEWNMSIAEIYIWGLLTNFICLIDRFNPKFWTHKYKFTEVKFKKRITKKSV